jgi:two-component system response regulator DesR
VIRVLIAEDQGMVRGALASLLALEPDVEVVAQVARGDEVVAAAQAATPDVALLDIEMPGATGLEAAEELRRELPACRVLILTTFGRPGYLRRAMEGGRRASSSRTRRPASWRGRFAGPWRGSASSIRASPRTPCPRASPH